MEKTQNKNLIRIVGVASVFLLMLVARPVFAARLSFSTPTRTVGTEQTFEVKLLLNTGGERINALSGTITFANSATELINISNANSVIPLWVVAPHKTPKGITFAGVIPGGYNGSNGLVITLTLRGTRIGTNSITLQSASAFLNDGTGSEVPVTTTPLFVSINASSHKKVFVQKDTIPPESFTPHVARELSVFNNRWFVAFSTTDKGTGIARYEVKEAPIQILAMFLPWVSVTSPHVLTNQGLTDYIYVRAIDHAGNSRTEEINPPHVVWWYGNAFILGILLLMGGAFALIYKVWKHVQ